MKLLYANTVLVDQGFKQILPYLREYVISVIKNYYHTSSCSKEDWWTKGVIQRLNHGKDPRDTGKMTTIAVSYLPKKIIDPRQNITQLDISATLQLIIYSWTDMFIDEINKKYLPPNGNSLARSLKGFRDKISHLSDADLPKSDAEDALEKMIELCKGIPNFSDVTPLLKKIKEMVNTNWFEQIESHRPIEPICSTRSKIQKPTIIDVECNCEIISDLNKKFDFEIDEINKSATLVKYNGQDEILIVPDEIRFDQTSYLVRTINAKLFENNTTLKKITLPKFLKDLGWGAFYNCSSLESVQFNNELNEIRFSTFESCINLKEIYFPNKLECIKGRALANCKSLTTISLPWSLKLIGPSSFNGCVKLEFIEIPGNVEKIDTEAFINTSLKLVSIFNEDMFYVKGENASFPKDAEIITYSE